MNAGTAHHAALKITDFSDTEALKRLAWNVKDQAGAAWKSLEFFGDGAYLQSNAAITVASQSRTPLSPHRIRVLERTTGEWRVLGRHWKELT